MKLSKKLASIGLAVAMVASIGATSAFAGFDNENVKGGSVELMGSSVESRIFKKVDVDGGLGEWSYGTGINSNLNKTVYSNLNHSSKVHRSSCQIDNDFDDSDWTESRLTSYSSAEGNLNSTAYANWDVK